MATKIGNPYERFSRDELILRDELAIDRTRLANERTLLAYIRTALAFARIRVGQSAAGDQVTERPPRADRRPAGS